MINKKSVLLVEDEPRIRAFVKDYLIKEGIKVWEASDGQEAIEQFSHRKYDLVLLDIMIPKLNGWDVCKIIREQSDVVIIMLTAKDGEHNHLKGYELGVNDYIEKPFSIRVLLAKIKAFLGTTTAIKNEENISISLAIKELKFNLSERVVHLKGVKINFTLKEFELLLFLAQNKRQALSRQQILDNVWGVDYTGTDRTIDACIKRIRTKLGDWELPLTAIRGVGYRLEVIDQ